MLRRESFARDPVTCARALVGCELRWGRARGVIVETEAYAAEGDEASHTFFRPGARAFVATHRPGAAYVYLNYGVHWMLNVLCLGGGGAADGFVLIRAVRPLAGLACMRTRRGRVADTALCAGPGRLTQAFAIDGGDHGIDLCSRPSRAFHAGVESPEIIADLRIGITRSAELPWRFLAADALSWVSRRPTRKG